MVITLVTPASARPRRSGNRVREVGRKRSFVIATSMVLACVEIPVPAPVREFTRSALLGQELGRVNYGAGGHACSDGPNITVPGATRGTDLK